jgi:UDP-GlcNAc3NAcA epimerase
MKVLYIVGNRPQFIKLAVLHQQAKQHPTIQEFVIHTGQHFSPEMSAVFFKELSIDLPINYLNIDCLPHATMIGQMMIALEPAIEKCIPDYIVVFGDTNSTLAGALTAKKMNIPVVHIEAGIRTFEENMPEESNRYLTDRISAVNFCCTPSGMEHLKNEGFDSSQVNSKIFYSGDLMLDAYNKFYPQFSKLTGIIDQLPVQKHEYILLTLHRKQNLEQPKILAEIIEAINEINRQIPVVCPLHPNTKKLLHEYKINYDFITIPPVGYLDMQSLLHNCKYVITDSGGLQREVFFAKKHALILMEKPFWPEVIEYGCALKSSSKKEDIVTSFAALLQIKRNFETGSFGSGNAAQIIINYLLGLNKV